MRFIIFLSWLLIFSFCLYAQSEYEYNNDGIVRLDKNKKVIYLSFTGHEFADGGKHIIKVLKKNNIMASFFFTGDFYRNKEFNKLIRNLRRAGNYLGAHSDKHLLYCDWTKRDSTLISEELFKSDLMDNYKEMERFGITIKEARYFMPPYEWYNSLISKWSEDMGIKIVNFTPGTFSNADYTTPEMGNRYVNSDTIYNRILRFEENSDSGLNGFILLLHIGTHADRTDKMYTKLDPLIQELKRRGYLFKTFHDIK
jgi:peptidoglycan/xylan/chitin deacetylase (PgdA/CDA1 family)